MIFVDTDVLIDCLRWTVPAQAWLSRVTDQPLHVPGVVAMELVFGCRDQSDITQVQKFLSAFTIVWPDTSEFALAYDLLIANRLTSGLSIPDYLIASIAIARGAPLYTFNHKHFRVISGLDVQQPYSR